MTSDILIGHLNTFSGGNVYSRFWPVFKFDCTVFLR